MQYHVTYNHAFNNSTFLHLAHISQYLINLHTSTVLHISTSIPSHGAYLIAILHFMSRVKVSKTMHLKHRFKKDFLLRHRSNAVQQAYLWAKLSS